MNKAYRHWKKYIRSAASAGFTVFLCLYVFFLAASLCLSGAADQGEVDYVPGSTSNAERFLDYCRGLHSDVPAEARVENIPLGLRETEALRTTGVFSAGFGAVYRCSSRQGAYSCPENSRKNIVSNIKNKFYCRI